MDLEPCKFKILTVGDTGVGKTSLLIRHQSGEFKQDTKNTIGVDFSLKTYIIDKKRYDLAIWDTAGQERFRSVTSAYYRGAHAAFVVFDITNIDSFLSVENWVSELRKEFVSNNNHQEPLLILIGNKVDLPGAVVTQKDINNMAEKLKISQYISTSAKTGEHVDNMFSSLLNLLMQRHQGSTTCPGSIRLKNNCNITPKSKCCS